MSEKIPALMRFDPVDGTENPFPSEAKQYRLYHGRMAWLFNPYTGTERHPADIGTDVLGFAIRRPCGACGGKGHSPAYGGPIFKCDPCKGTGEELLNE